MSLGRENRINFMGRLGTDWDRKEIIGVRKRGTTTGIVGQLGNRVGTV